MNNHINNLDGIDGIDDIIIEVVRDRLAQSDCEKYGWMLDGFPRTQAQAEAIATLGIRPDKVIYLDVPSHLLIERIVGRRRSQTQVRGRAILTPS